MFSKLYNKQTINEEEEEFIDILSINGNEEDIVWVSISPLSDEDEDINE